MKKLLFSLFAFYTGFAIMAEVVIVSQDTSVSEHTAARRLAYYLKQMFKEDIKVTKEANSPAIYIGKNSKTAEMLGLKDFSSLKYEEIIIKSVGSDLVILGEGKRGTLYAMYTYLEDFLGFRFWAWKEYDVPDKSKFKMSGIDYRYNPVFTRRAMYQWPLPHLPAQWKSGDPEFAVICRNNSGLTHTAEKYGKGDYSAGFTHTFHRILPQRKYFKVHPEYYAMINGKRNSRGQLCLSNKEMRKTFIEEAKQFYIKNKGSLSITVAHDDNGLFCECPACQDLLKREKGRLAGVEIDFVNEVASELEKIYPGIIVETSAYGPTILPPLVTMPRKNVIIRYADMGINPGYPITHDANKEACENFKAWAKISSQMAIWLYTTNAKKMAVPQPVMDTYAENIKFFRENKITNIFIEDNAGGMGLAHLNPLRTYIVSRMLWNPYLDYNKLLHKFTDGYYGKKAGAVIRDYIKQIHEPLKHKITGSEFLSRLKKGYLTEYYIKNNKSLISARKYPDAMVYPPVAVYMDSILAYMSRENMIKCFRLMEKAISVAEDETFRERVKDSAFSIRVALLTDYDIADTPEQYGFTSQGLKKLAQICFEDAKRIGNRRLGLANSGLGSYKNQVARIHSLKKKPIPDFLQGVNSKTLEFFNYNDWSLMIPKRASIINDPDSLDKKAYRMLNTKTSWALQCRNIASSVRQGKYKMYLRFRMIPKNGHDVKPGIFFNASYYQRGHSSAKTSSKNDMIRADTTEFKDGKYHWKYAGTHDVNSVSAAYFFADPCNHPDVEAIVIDQLLLQRIDK